MNKLQYLDRMTPGEKTELFKSVEIDFLVDKIDGKKEIHEVNGTQFLDNPDTIRKHERARTWCRQRGMNFIVVTKSK